MVRMTESEFEKLSGNKSEKNNKYRNKKIKQDGMTFDSIGERDRYEYLKILEKSKEISNLTFHKENIILIDDPLVKYIPDFCYDENGKHIVEDFKGVQTKEFILKKKMIISMIKKGQLDIVFRITKKENGYHIVEEYSKQ